MYAFKYEEYLIASSDIAKARSLVNERTLYNASTILYKTYNVTINILLELCGTDQWKANLSDFGSANIAQNIYIEMYIFNPITLY